MAIAALAMHSSPAWAFAPPLGQGLQVLQPSALVEPGSMMRRRGGLLDANMCLSRPDTSYGGATPATSGKALERAFTATTPLPPHIIHSQIPNKCLPSGMAPAEPHQIVGKVKIDAVVWGLAAGVAMVLAVAFRTPVVAGLLAIAEVLFFVLQYLQAREMNAPPRPEPVRRDVGELWRMCMRGSPDGPESFIVGWFYDKDMSDISREDMEDFVSWAIFSSTFELLNPASVVQALHVIDIIEEELAHTFPARLPSQLPLPNMRFSIEPIKYTPKPLLYYGVAQGVLQNVGHSQLLSEGFQRHRSGDTGYWIRVPETVAGRGRMPMVFVHGVGVGLVTYMSMIKEFMKLDCPIICVELPFISSNIHPVVPRIDDQVDDIDKILLRWGIKKATFVGHSYGSVILSWMIQQKPERVAGLAFLDPVVFMLNLKDILYNFLYRYEVDGKISDVVGSELYLNNALRRNFWWYRNILWASDMQKHDVPTLVCLSEKDEIVPVRAVLDHLAEHASLHPEDNLVEPYLMEGANHGEMLFSDEILVALTGQIASLYAKVDARNISQMMRQTPIRTPLASLFREVVGVTYKPRQAVRRFNTFLRGKGVPLPVFNWASGR
eukprot:CAMPEP_0180142584 /NCGR_PEP_ID=MMETSP0986-20121125/15673_1 /TAXON_ID=697907 /ORGANISM="non described non described, Strain CCMP2293" /LENGTH=606 /DNA_ID=CAMNT_0022085821 /DNA_START=19 /DNA_END=1839 /DNA_ORIENTATION=-